MDAPLHSGNATLDFANFLMSLIQNGSNDSAAGPGAGLTGHGYFAEIVALILSGVSMLANISGVLAILQVDKQLTTNLRLVLSLCLSDLLISLCIMLDTLYLGTNTPPSHNSVCVTMTLRALRMTSHIISLHNLFGLALDHYIKLVKPFQYPVVMHPQRACIMIIMFWVLAFLCGFSDFYVPAAYFSFCEPRGTHCLPVHCSAYNSEYLMFAVTLLLFLVMACIYTKIFTVIWSHRKFQARYRNLTPKKRGLLTTLLILGTFVVCWLPYCVFEITVLVGTLRHLDIVDKHLGLITKVDKHLYNLLLLNCLCDPVIYATRMQDVRNGYHRLLQRILQVPKDIKSQITHSHQQYTATETSTRQGSIDSGQQRWTRAPPCADTGVYRADATLC